MGYIILRKQIFFMLYYDTGTHERHVLYAYVHLSWNRSTVQVLVDIQEGSIWSIVLRCDQIYLLITQEVFLRAMVAPVTRTFVRPPRHRACHIIYFAQKNTPLDRHP